MNVRICSNLCRIGTVSFAIASDGLMLRSHPLSPFTLALTAWILAPHAQLILVSRISKSDTAQAFYSLLAIVVAGWGFFAYYQTQSSTSERAYLWIPLWQFVVAAAAFSIASLFRSQPPLDAERSPSPPPPERPVE